MDARFAARLESAPADVMAQVADLATYPSWLSIVHTASAESGSEPPAWHVEIGARLGPISRTKRLRMARTVDEADEVRFERAELDGRPHPAWVLSATTSARPDGGTDLAVHLHYGGAPGIPLLDRVLAQEARRAGARLERLVRNAADYDDDR